MRCSTVIVAVALAACSSQDDRSPSASATMVAARDGKVIAVTDDARQRVKDDACAGSGDLAVHRRQNAMDHLVHVHVLRLVHDTADARQSQQAVDDGAQMADGVVNEVDGLREVAADEPPRLLVHVRRHVGAR